MNAPLSLLQTQYDAWLASAHPMRPQMPVAGQQVRHLLKQSRRWLEALAPGWQALEAIWQSTPERVWAWSDLHLFHENIISYSERPFSNTDIMHEQLLARAQERVREGDWLVFLGDVALGRDRDGVAEWLRACPGRKALILGNHDVRTRLVSQGALEWQDLGFEAVADCWSLERAGQQAWLTHYPMGEALLPARVLNFHGHVHQHSLPTRRHRNFSVEAINYQPQRLEDFFHA